ncbi:MAG: hypothetical protein EOP86_16115 [Verrucomicrobiaceae bacterium]|nr:MAG: hypothetical protein EOP86_16115 [Verrucomicrobiaceae bacterium]
MTGQLLQYLESLRSPVATMAGLPVGSIVVFAQQDLMSHVAKTMAQHQCAVVMGITGLSLGAKADARVPGPPVDADLEISVWTPEVVMHAGAPLAMDVMEAIIAGLHGRRPPEGAPGMALVPQFQRSSVVSEGGPGSAGRFLVATVNFSVPVYLKARRSTAAD